jgi:hypothetical protein
MARDDVGQLFDCVAGAEIVTDGLRLATHRKNSWFHMRSVIRRLAAETTPDRIVCAPACKVPCLSRQFRSLDLGRYRR